MFQSSQQHQRYRKRRTERRVVTEMVKFLLAQVSVQPSVSRSVFYPHCESSYPARSLLHYYTACKVYYQTISKYSKPDLPRKVVSSPWESIHSVTHIDNGAQAKLFEEKKKTFLQEGKVDEFGSVRETFLFHGSSKESINKIVEGHLSPLGHYVVKLIKRCSQR